MSAKKYQYAVYTKKGRIAYVTINRPEVMNSLHPPAHRELAEIFDDFRDDDGVWVAIVTGAGDRAFSAGRDLKYTATHPEVQRTSQVLRPGGSGGITNRYDCWKPLIAAVNGYALGGGCELALACDIIVAADHARFGLPEPTVGLIAGAGGVHRLPRHIPMKVAMGYLLTGKHMPAQEALRWGLVNEVVPLKNLMAAAERWAADVMGCAPLSVRATKEAAMRGLSMPLDEAMNYQFHQTLLMRASEDTIEGPKAFAEKRAPAWKGR